MIKINGQNKLGNKISSQQIFTKTHSPIAITAADFLEQSHNPSNTQFIIDHLYSDIKVQKKKLKKTNSITGFLKSLFDSFIKDEFEKKLTKYKEELNELSENDGKIDGYFYTGALTNHPVHEEKFRNYKKRLILLEIIDILNDLIEGQSELGLTKLNELEISVNEINGEGQGYVHYNIDEFYPIISEIKATIKDRIKGLQKKLILLLRLKYRMVGRDIRQSFRNIIRIIFKNMDDQSGDDHNLFVYIFIQQQIINQKFWFHEQKNNYRPIDIHYRY